MHNWIVVPRRYKGWQFRPAFSPSLHYPRVGTLFWDCVVNGNNVGELLLSYQLTSGTYGLFSAASIIFTMHRHTSSRSLSAVVRGRRSLAGYPPCIRLLSVGQSIRYFSRNQHFDNKIPSLNRRLHGHFLMLPALNSWNRHISSLVLVTWVVKFPTLHFFRFMLGLSLCYPMGKDRISGIRREGSTSISLQVLLWTHWVMLMKVF